MLEDHPASRNLNNYALAEITIRDGYSFELSRF
jgi:hypothetical protein